MSFSMATFEKKHQRNSDIHIYIYTHYLFLFLYEGERERYIYIPGYSLVTNFWPGQILVWFLSSFFKFVHFHFKITWPFQEKTYHFMFSFLSHVESARAFPPFSRVFPPFSREFPPRKIDIFYAKKSKISPRGRKYKIDHNGQKMTISRSFTRNPP